MSLINRIALQYYSGRLRKIEAMAHGAEAMQMGELRRLMCHVSETAFGREHGLVAGTSYADFARQVLVRDYNAYSGYVERMLRGEAGVCWPGLTRWFAKSSGTTGSKSKFIPVSEEALRKCHYRGAQDVVAVYLRNHPSSGILSGKCLTLGGSKKIASEGAHCQTGDLSAIMIGNSPWWSQAFKTPRTEIALIDRWEEKLERLTEATVGERGTYLAGVPSWFLILLRHIMERQGVGDIQSVWPQLELFIHGGINFEPYRRQYEQIAPKGLNFMETYNASEGFFALQDDPSDKGMSLMLDYGIFYEFVPLDEVGQEHPSGAVPLWGVETGRDYAIVISTNGGLWRYMIGDTVRFTQREPYKIVISGRTKLYINAFGEELMIGNAEAAMRKACDATGAEVKEYTAAPVFMGLGTHGCHQWLVEFEPRPDDMGAFARTLDKALQDVNSDYEAKRYKDITLDPLVLTEARPGLFFDWLKSVGKLGGQNKVPRLANDRTVMDELLKFNNRNN